MVDYKKGFELLQRNLDVAYHATRDNNVEVFTYYDGDFEENGYLNNFELNEEEASILNDCLESVNDEPDSMDKIKAEFNEFGYNKIEEDDIKIKLTYHKLYYLTIYRTGAIVKTALNGRAHTIHFKEMQLIYRVLKLWGKEV